MSDALLTRHGEIAELHRILGGSSPTHANLSAETLELLGKQAAAMFLEEHVPLTDGVVKLASQYENITPEQVKRVVEHANTSVYLTYHGNDKVAGAGSSYPQFTLADPKAAMSKLSHSGERSAEVRTSSAYGRSPEKAKLSSASRDQALADLFGHKPVKERHFTKESAVAEVMNAKGDLTSLKDQLESSAQHFDILHKTASAEYYDTVKRHLLGGDDFAGVLVAARSIGLSSEKTAAVLKPVVEQLLLEKVAKPDALKEGIQKLEKLAHRIVNNEHPLVTQFAAVAGLDAELEKTAVALGSVDVELGRVNAFIKEKFR